MKIGGFIGMTVAFIVVGLLVYLARYGLFAVIKITEKNMGPYLLVYKKHIGDYKQVGKVMDKLYEDLKDTYSISTTKGFGLYYDNPQDVATEKLRSVVGCIVEGKGLENLSGLSGKYGVKVYPASKSVAAEFPYKGKISIFLGILKVYPKLGAYLKERQHPSTPIMELYDQPNEKITYIASVELSKEIFDSFLTLSPGE